MINPYELRLGNIVLMDGKETKIYSVDESGVNIHPDRDGDEYDYFFSNPTGWASRHKEMAGIPLTPERLMKFGFRNLSVSSREIDYYLPESKHHFVLSVKTDGRIFYDNFEIKTVHQLQNLYHSLTLE